MEIPLGVNAHQPQLLPTPLHYVLDAKIELTAHDDRLWLPGQLVKKVKGDRVDFVVNVETSMAISAGSQRCCIPK